jgi:hypothetical protein
VVCRWGRPVTVPKARLPFAPWRVPLGPVGRLCCWCCASCCSVPAATIKVAQRIEHWPLDRLVPYERNARTHSAEQIAGVAASIKEFGFTNPILVASDDGILAGHGRLQAAKELAMDTVPVVVLDHLTPKQRRAYVLADNKLALNAGWDDALLVGELQALQADEFDLSLLGWSGDELDELLSETEELSPEDAGGDAVPEPPTDPVTRPGDVWLLGPHRVMCGDATDAGAVHLLLAGQAWDVCVFDPPYEIEDLYDQMPAPQQGSRLVVMWDFKRFAKAAASAVAAGWQPQYEFIWDCVQSWYTPNRPLARHKAAGVFGDNPHFDTEAALIADAKDRGSTRTVANTRGSYSYTPLAGAKHVATVEAFANTAQSSEHAHGKPVAWVQAILAGLRASTVLDLFGGGGTTIIACERIGGQALTMELNPAQCDVIVRRWQEFTGNSATLESTGEPFPVDD